VHRSGPIAAKRAAKSAALTGTSQLWLVLGMACFMLASEGDRITTLRTTSIGAGTSLIAYGTFLGLALCALLYALKPGFFQPRGRSLAPISLLMALGLFLYIDPLGIGLGAAAGTCGRILSWVCEGLLFFCWMPLLLELGSKRTAILLGLATILFGLLSLGVAGLPGVVGNLCTVAAPLLCALCLAPALPFLAQSQRRHSVSGQWSHRLNWEFGLGLLVPFIAYAFIFGRVHADWVQLQDGSMVSALIWLGVVAGNVLAGLIIFLTARFAWSHNAIQLIQYALLVLVCLVLWLSVYSSPLLVFLYLLVLNAANALLVLLITLSPFIFLKPGRALSPHLGSAPRRPVKPSRILLPWWLGFLAFAAGRSLSGAATVLLGDSWLFAGSLLALSLAILCTFAELFLISCAAAPLSTAVAGGDPMSAPASNPALGFDDQPRPRFKLAVQQVALTYSLSERESQILSLIGHGLNAGNVAAELVISPATAKTHFRNLYTKLGLHSQQEIIKLLETTISEQAF
jgi:DNA-binding CsgD family transcriptional regulator